MRYSVQVAYILWLFSGCGALGFHRFYLGKVPTGILWFVSGGLGMVGSLYDFFTLRRQVWEANARLDYRAALELGPERRVPRPSELASRRESVERVILRTARKNDGAVTPGEVALEADVSIEEARKALDKLAAAGHAELRVRSSGVVVYVFGDFARGAGGDYVV